MRGKNTRGRIMLLSLVISGLVCFGSTGDLAAAPQGVLQEAIHWGLSADWLDPGTATHSTSAFLILYLIHDGLIKPMPDGTYSPSLAESWTVGPDAKMYEFKLRKGVKFHNGDLMTAEDVIFSFKRYKATAAKTFHDHIEKMEAVNPHLVRFYFKRPFPDFLEYLLPGASTLGWIVPKKYVEEVGDERYKKKPIGCGPYKFVEFEAGVKLVGEAFEEYWRKVPKIKRMEFRIVPEPGTRLTMVKRGEADIATLMQGVFYESAQKDPKLRVLSPLSPTIWLVYFAGQWDPKSPWSDPRVRKAASLAIDRQTLADVHMPGCAGAGSVGIEGDPFVVKFPPDPYDPAKAKELLAQAGYPNGFQGGRFYPYGGYWPYGEQITNYWKAVGITMDTVLLDRPAFLAQRRAKKMKGGTFIDSSLAPTIGGRLDYLFGPTSYGNYPEIESLWKQYNQAIQQNQRKEIIGQIQKLIHDKAMYLPLTTTNSPAAFGPRPKGNPYRVQPLLWFTAPFEDMELND
jgi:peptide/nickel transport system substrate-binding protein